ncbi:MAG: peroxiredoxin-like family protein [Pseudomonadota bacterium]
MNEDAMLQPCKPAPALTVPLTAGGTYTLGETPPESFEILVFYRGKHCPICRDYLQAIEALLDDVAAEGVRIAAFSMDEETRAKTSVADWGITRLPVGYALPEAVARAYGLYISSKREGSAEPERFSEPGLFVLDPDGVVFFAQTQSAPFTRPDIATLLRNLKFVKENNYPARGDLTEAA